MEKGFEKFEYPNNKTTGWFKITHILFTFLVFFLDYIISGEMFWNRIGFSVLIMVSAFVVSFLSWVFEKSLNKSVKMFWNSNLFDYLLTSFEKPQKRKTVCLSLIFPNLLVLFPLILIWMLTYEEPFVSRAFFDI